MNKASTNRSNANFGNASPTERTELLMKWSQETGQSAKVFPEPLKGYEHGKAPELYRSV